MLCHAVGFCKVSNILKEWMPLRDDRAQLVFVVFYWPDSMCDWVSIVQGKEKDESNTHALGSTTVTRLEICTTSPYSPLSSESCAQPGLRP